MRGNWPYLISRGTGKKVTQLNWYSRILKHTLETKFVNKSKCVEKCWTTDCREGGEGEEWDPPRQGRSGLVSRRVGGNSSTGGDSFYRNAEAPPAWAESATVLHLPSWCKWPITHPLLASMALSSALPCCSMESCFYCCFLSLSSLFLLPLMLLLLLQGFSCFLLTRFFPSLLRLSGLAWFGLSL